MAQRSGRVVSGAFTIIELLVVIAIITLLVSILLPSLSAAREHAKEVVCGATLRGFGTGFANYMYSNKEWIPGYNTSGIANRVLEGSAASELDVPSMPVQPFDWMTPILMAENTVLPTKRIERFALLMEQFRCPSLKETECPVIGFSSDEAEEVEKVKTWFGTSYLMPAYFQFVGEEESGKRVASLKVFSGLSVRTKAAPDFYEVRVPRFEPRMGRVGTPADKIFAADATRYLSKDDFDYDISPSPDYFGAFTTSGAWWSGSTAFGVNPEAKPWDGDTPVGRGSPSDGQNLTLTYRHSQPGGHQGRPELNLGYTNALYFDGHVELLNDRNSRKIGQWYPKGGIVRNDAQGLTVLPQDYVIN